MCYKNNRYNLGWKAQNFKQNGWLSRKYIK